MTPYLVLATLVPLTPETPYGDDFDYSATAWHLADTGVLRLSDWPTTMLASHAAWGALFCKLGGNSYLMLRASMFVLSAAAAVTLFEWCRRLGHSTAFSVWCGVTFALNSLVVSLEYSFLTDMTGAALSVVLLYFGRRLPQVCRAPALSSYGGLGGIAWLARQTAAIPFVFSVAFTSWEALRSRASWIRVGLLLGPFLICFLGYRGWLNWAHGVPHHHSFPFLRIGTLSDHIERLAIVLLGLGLHLLPFAAMLAASISGAVRSWPWKTLLTATGFMMVVCTACPHWPNPCVGELFDLGLHSLESPPGAIPTGLHGPTAIAAGRSWSLFRLATTGAAFVSIVILLTAAVWWIGRLRSMHGDPWSLLATVSLLANLGLLQVTWVFVDRYLLGVIPIAVMVFAEFLPLDVSSRRTSLWAGWMATVTIGAFSIVGIQDGMQRTTAFWNVARQMKELGVDAQDVDAGLAYGGVYRYTPTYRGPNHVGPYLDSFSPKRRQIAQALYSPLTVVANRKLGISFGGIDGYDAMARHTFRSWFRSGEVLILKRRDVRPSDLPHAFNEWIQSGIGFTERP